MGTRARRLVVAVAVVGAAAWATERASSNDVASPALPAPRPVAPAPAEGASERQAAPSQAATTTAIVGSVVDGDTLTLVDGRQVRLAQVDAPERNECFGSESTAALRALAPAGAEVHLRRPSNGPERDRYGRTLAEVSVGGESVDERLVRDGAAEWYDRFAAEDPDIARRLEQAEQDARAAGRGLWSACHGGRASAPPVSAGSVPTATGACDAAYPDACIPPAPPDLDCGNVEGRAFTVRSPDPHGFDGDGDGVGCEG